MVLPRLSLLCLHPESGGKKSVGREGWLSVLIVVVTNVVGFKSACSRQKLHIRTNQAVKKIKKKRCGQLNMFLVSLL